ncbi:MAG: ABC transporter ATP-binding protein [Bacteroidota bacterium]
MGALSRLNVYFGRYKHLFIPGLLCAMAASLFQISVPGVVRQAVDSVPRFVSLYQQFEGTPVQGYLLAYIMAALLFFAGVIVALSLVSGLFSFLMRRTLVVASRHIEYDLRNRLYDHLQTLPQAFYHAYSTGDVITRATSDIEQTRRYIGPAVMYSTRAIVTMATAITVMLIISPRLTFFALLPMPLLAVSVFVVARLVYHRSEHLQQQYSALTTRVQESLSGIRVLKAYTREDAEASVFEQESSLYRQRSLSLALVDAFWRPVFLVLIGLSTLIVVWVGGRLAIAGTITIGNIVEYMIYVAYMTWPVASVGFVISMVQRASASMNRLNQIFDTVPSIRDTDATDPSIEHIDGAIRFEHVRFRYSDDGPWVLDDISFEVPAGSTLAIVGRTGSGKSTLINLIPRLLDPVEGVVRIDGHEAPTVPLEVLRSNIGYVPQEVFLFSDTVANNIAFGVLDAPRTAVERAALEADLLANIESFPAGFETFVGERGITLSGGQKQRSSIARALIRAPGILILDDALSAVDTKTEATILGHLRQHYGQRTVVLVSHRISAVQDADQILVLDEGRILERGTHASLIAQDGLYADLHRKQLLEQEIAGIGEG